MHVSEACLVDTAAERFKSVLLVFKLASAANEEIFGGEYGFGRGKEVCAFVNVEGKDGVDTMSGVVWGVA